MKNFLNFFVTAPAWKIFSLLMLPILLLFIIPDTSTSMIISKTLLLFGLWTTLLWIYSIGVLIYEKYSSFLTVPIMRFKICLTYDFIYSALVIYGIIPFDYLIPFYLISFVCKIYALYFVSKLIVVVERRSDVKFQDYLGIIIAAWFYLIGIWFIQPRINKIFLSNDI